MGDLTTDFSRWEFWCHCGKCAAVEPSSRLVVALQVLRDNLGRRVSVLCGIRCRDHNKAAKGAPDSRHLPDYADAADIRVEGMTLSQLYVEVAGILEFHRGGIGIYPEENFIHVDTRPNKARWGQIGGAKVQFMVAWEALQKQEEAACAADVQAGSVG